MASNGIAHVIESELQHYPGVTMELKNGGKHDRAVFHFGDKSRFLTIPKTPSDWRANGNMKRDIKKTLGELGVERLYHKSPRHGRRTRHADAAIAINKNNIVVLIPAHSRLLDRFKTKDGKATHKWEFELRASADLQAPPLIAVRQVTVPAGQPKKWGVTTGTPHKTGGWILALRRSNFPKLGIESLSSIDVKLYEEHSNELVFKLPEGALPTSFHPRRREDVEPAPLPSQAWPEPKPEVERVDKPEDADKVLARPNATSTALEDKPIILQFPKQTISIEQAVALLNRRKQQLGNSLRFTIEEGGYISAVHRIGK